MAGRATVANHERLRADHHDHPPYDWDFKLHRAQYVQLVDALQHVGYDTKVDRWPSRAQPQGIILDIIIHVGELGATAKGLADLTQVIRTHSPARAVRPAERSAQSSDLWTR